MADYQAWSIMRLCVPSGYDIPQKVGRSCGIIAITLLLKFVLEYRLMMSLTNFQDRIFFQDVISYNNNLSSNDHEFFGKSF